MWEIISIILALDICEEFSWLVMDVGGATFGEIVLGAIRKQDEQAMGIKAVSKESGVSAWPPYPFQPPGSCLSFAPLNSLCDGL